MALARSETLSWQAMNNETRPVPPTPRLMPEDGELADSTRTPRTLAEHEQGEFGELSVRRLFPAGALIYDCDLTW